MHSTLLCRESGKHGTMQIRGRVVLVVYIVKAGFLSPALLPVSHVAHWLWGRHGGPTPHDYFDCSRGLPNQIAPLLQRVLWQRHVILKIYLARIPYVVLTNEYVRWKAFRCTRQTAK